MPTKQPSFLARTTLGPPNYLLVAMATIFMLAMAPLGAWLAAQRTSNQAHTWLAASHGVAKLDREFRDQFEAQQFVLVSWDDCTLGKPGKLATLARKLQGANGVVRIETGPQWIERLTSAPYGWAEEGAVARLEGTFVGPTQRDERGASLGQASRLTCLAAYLTPIAAGDDAQVAAVLEQIRRAAAESGVEPASLRIAGPAIDSLRVGQESTWAMLRWGGLAVLLGSTICLWRLRSFQLAALVTIPAIAGGAATLAIVYYSGVLEVLSLGRSLPLLGVADSLVLATPLLTYALTLLAGLRLIYYYRDARLAHGVDGAAERAVADGWPAWAIVALLFAAVMGAFCYSELLPLRRFGLFAGMGALASVGALLSIIPVWLHRFPTDERQIQAIAGPRRDGSLSPRLASIFEAAISGRGMMAGFGLLVFMLALAGVRGLAPSTQLPVALADRSTLASDYDWFGARIGHAVPMEVVLKIPGLRNRRPDESAEADGQQYRMTLAEQLWLVDEVEQRIRTLPEISGTLSAATLQPAAGGQIEDEEIANTVRQDCDDLELLQAEQRAGSDVRTGMQLWRISGRLMAATPGVELDYLSSRARLRSAVAPVVLSYEQRDWLLRELHERGGQLQRANVCVLYRGSADSAAPAANSAEALFGSLMARSGVQGGAVKYFNLAQLERGDEINADAIGRASETLKYAHAVVLAAQPADLAAAGRIAAATEQLAQAGVNVVDVSKLPAVEESATQLAVQSGGPGPILFEMTGAPIIAATITEELVATLDNASYWIIPGLIAAMMCVVWHPVVGLATVAAVTLPLALTLGVMGWAGVKFDLGIVLVAGLGLGTAFDSAVHYVAWYRRGIEAGLFRQEAARMAFARCAPATVDGALAVGIGLTVLALSPVTSLHELGIAALGLEMASLFAALVVMPAIMASPLTGMMGADAAPEDAAVEMTPVRIVLPGEGDGEIRPGRTDVAAAGVPAPAHRGRSGAPAGNETAAADGPHATLQAKLQRLRHAGGE
ncbi:MMPL family transporter [Lacipirellula parvula]|uniref:Membrane transport protein MMPL domain-containing protein n=1 Tax=Lacipirellula parvula TaxID=2650471 RepID=A0A5K7XAS0_9BACT|nr:MMPL family transporter [Lacipirellula parvula]BBO31426.1 hypothetical protein PLANPX_1038 [Lacipirellula parvula]